MMKSNEAETKPSTKVLSSWARNFLRKFSPSPSNLVSKFRAEPISPPISKEARIANNVHPLGSADVYLSDHIGANALTDPRIVIKPKTSVINVLVRVGMRPPTKTPIAAPPIMVAIFTVVPKPTNIAVTIEDINSGLYYKLPKCESLRSYRP